MVKHSLLGALKIVLIFVVFLVSCTPGALPATAEVSQPIPTTQPMNTQIPTATPIPEIIVGVVEVDVLNVREGPGTSYPILGALNKGEKFYILGDVVNSTNNKWLLISPSSNSFGWVIGDQSYVTIQKEIVDLSTYLIWQKNVEDAKSALVTATASP